MTLQNFRIDFWKILISNSIQREISRRIVCVDMGYILILPTILMRITIICVGVECDNLRRRRMRCSVKSDTKRIWTPYQEISCDTEFYHKFEFVVYLRYSANAFWKICVGESKKSNFWIVLDTSFRIESEPERIWLHPGNSNFISVQKWGFKRWIYVTEQTFLIWNGQREIKLSD